MLHTRSSISSLAPAGVLAAAALLAFAPPSLGQPYEVRRGDLTLRSSTVSSERIDPATAARHGIEPSARTSVLNVVLLRGNARETVPAEVSATARSLAGVRQEIGMREVRENGRVSYIGSYDVLPREVIDLEVKAKPLQAEQPPTLVLRWRERMWAIGDGDAAR